MSKMEPLDVRFWRKVDRRGPDECWLWTATLGANGYGYIGEGGHRGRVRAAHRVSYELAHGAIPPQSWVLHRCDVGMCVNPAHLFLGTHADNMRDMAQKGRWNGPRGTAHRSAKLNPSAVLKMRALSRSGTPYRELGRLFGVSDRTVCAAVRGETWRSVVSHD